MVEGSNSQYYGQNKSQNGAGWGDWASGVFNGTRQVINQKVSMTNKFFSSNFSNGQKTNFQQQQQNGFGQ